MSNVPNSDYQTNSPITRDPALGNTPVNQAATETMGKMDHSGIAPSPTAGNTLPTMYGAPKGVGVEDHNSQSIQKNFGGSS